MGGSWVFPWSPSSCSWSTFWWVIGQAYKGSLFSSVSDGVRGSQAEMADPDLYSLAPLISFLSSVVRPPGALPAPGVPLTLLHPSETGCVLLAAQSKMLIQLCWQSLIPSQCSVLPAASVPSLCSQATHLALPRFSQEPYPSTMARDPVCDANC